MVANEKSIFLNQKFDSIQSLRGIAAFFVVLCHIHFIDRGNFGVDIFFCISGFIMMYITEPSTIRFLQKRILRIVPAYYLITFITFFFALLFPKLFHSSEATIPYLIKSLLFIPYERNGIIQPMLGVGWTLNYEMMFYFIFWISCKISHKYRSIICSFILIIMSIIGYLNDFSYIPFKFYTDTVILEFVLGMISFYVCKYIYNKSNDFKNVFIYFFKIICFIFSILIIIILWLTNKTYTNNLIQQGVPSFILFILFFTSLINVRMPKFLVKLGDISFSLYLVHYYTIFFFDRIIYPFDKLNYISAFVSIIAIIFSIISAYIYWFFIESKLTYYIKAKLFRSNNENKNTCSNA